MRGIKVVSPGHTQYVRQIEDEVDEPSTGGSKVGLGEEGTDEETLHDSRSGERHEEKEDNSGVAVRQYDTPLGKRERRIISGRTQETYD